MWLHIMLLNIRFKYRLFNMWLNKIDSNRQIQLLKNIRWSWIRYTQFWLNKIDISSKLKAHPNSYMASCIGWLRCTVYLFLEIGCQVHILYWRAFKWWFCSFWQIDVYFMQNPAFVHFFFFRSANGRTKETADSTAKKKPNE